MKKGLFFTLFLCFCGSAIAQIITKSIDSKILNAKRSISIKLPDTYDQASNIKHPVIVVLDGDFLYNPVVGQTDFQTYFKKMPASIVVGINHGDMRVSDNLCNKVSGLPEDSGAEFYGFIREELLAYIDENYNTNNFRVVVGYEKSVNLMNSFLLEEQPLFQAYVNLSPEYNDAMGQNIVDRIQRLNEDVIYYMTSTKTNAEDIATNLTSVKNMLSNIDNAYFKFYFDNFKEVPHHTLVMRGMAHGFEKVFDVYKPSLDRKRNDKLLSYENILD